MTLEAFLTKLGFQSRLKRHIQEGESSEKPPLQVPDYLWDIYDRIVERNDAEFPNFEDEESDSDWSYYADTIRNIFADSQLPRQISGSHGTLLTFNLTGINSEEMLTKSQLRLKFVGNRTRRVQISISEVIDSCQEIIQLLDTKIVPNPNGFDEDSIIFDVLPAIVRTLPRQNNTVLFFLQVREAHGKPVQNISNWVLLPSSSSNADSQSRAALLLYSADSSSSGTTTRAGRVKRGASRGKKRRGGRRRHGGRKKLRSRNNICKKRGLYVDFRELNWQDWILAPTGYEAFFCSGVCEYPIVNAQNTTNHAIVQSLVNSVSPGSVPPPCCVPTDMSAISMLYIDIDNRIVIKNYPEMIVEGCGCR